MLFKILGPLEVSEDGEVLPLAGPKQQTLLAVLLLHPSEPLSRERLIDELWGDAPPPTAAHNLHVYVSHLRKLLAAKGAAPSVTLATHSRGYLLEVEPQVLDLHEFEQLALEGRVALVAGDAELAAERLHKALGLWRGPALAGLVFESLAAGEVARLEELRTAALEDRVEADLALGCHAGLVGELESLARVHPLRERLHGQLMLALYRSGRQAEALRVFQETRVRLVGELGIEPGRSLQELERAILSQDRSLDPPTPTPAGRIATRPQATGRIALIAAALGLIGAVLATTAFLLSRGGHGIAAIDANAVGVIDPRTNKLVDEVPVGVRPQALAVGAGAVWVANLADDTISRIDVTTQRVSRNIAVRDYPSDITFGAGAVWVAHGPLATLTRVVPSADRVANPIRALGKEIGCGPPAASVTVGAGAVWFACESADLGRVNPRSDRSLRTGFSSGLLTSPSDVLPEFSDIAFGFGALWIANRSTNTVIELDPATNRTMRDITVGRAPAALAVDVRNQAVWVADFDDDAVTRINVAKQGLPSTTERIPVGDGPVDVCVGEGAIWVVNTRDGTVSRIDPKRNEVAASIRVGNAPQRVVAAAGRIWVTVQAFGGGAS